MSRVLEFNKKLCVQIVCSNCVTVVAAISCSIAKNKAKEVFNC